MTLYGRNKHLKLGLGADGMAQQVRALATTPDGTSLMPAYQVVEEENRLPRAVLCPHAPWHSNAHRRVLTSKYISVII